MSATGAQYPARRATRVTMCHQRPVGLYELAKIAALDLRAYPPRLPDQPIPVLNRPHAEDIASRSNPPDPNSGFAGFVTTFGVPDAAVERFPRKVVGASRHEERVPAEDQAWLQAQFEGPIGVVAAWAGARLSETLPSWRGADGPVAADALQGLVEAIAAGPVVGGPRTEGPR